MSVQQALDFINVLENDSSAAEQVESLLPGSPLQRLVDIGSSLGFQFAVDELRTALHADWTMRAAHYGRHA